jgi:parallel beta-helix repeat protein
MKKMKRVSRILINLLVIALMLQMCMVINSQSTFAANVKTYYVSTSGSDSGPGTEGEPFATIQKAVDRAHAGDTVIVRGGIYNVTESIIISNSGTKDNPITIKAYDGETPVIDGRDAYPHSNLMFWTNTVDGRAYTHSWDSLVSINGSHITFEGFEVKNSFGPGIHAAGSFVDESKVSEATINRISDITIRNCKASFNRCEGIVISYVDGFTVENCTVNGNDDFHMADHSGTSLGWPGALAADHSTNGLIKGSEVYNNWGEGIMTNRGCDYITIEDNIVYDNWAVQIYVESSSNTTVQRNLVYHTGDPKYFRSGQPCTGIAIADEGWTGVSTGHHRTIINNFVKGHKTNLAYWWWGGVDPNSNMNNDYIANNTLINATQAGLQISTAAVSHSNTTIENNIIYQDGGLLFDGEDSLTGITFSHNNWSSPVSGIASSPEDIIGDPMLIAGSVINDNYFRLKSSSPCIGAGKDNLSKVPTDYFGYTRVSAPTIGGYEYDPDYIPDQNSGLLRGELLVNGSFEKTTDPWFTGNGDIEVVSEEIHSGTSACKMINREYPWDSVMQDVAPLLTAAGQGSYTFGTWVKLGSDTDSAGPVLRIVDSTGTHFFGTNSIPCNSETWTECTWSGNITWTGNIISAVFYVETSNKSADMYVDDCTLVKEYEEVLENPGFETGVNLWNAAGGSIASETSIYHSGSQSCKLYGRGAPWDSVIQDVTTSLLLNGQGDYNMSAFVKLASGTAKAGPVLRIVDSEGVHYSGTNGIDCNSSDWTECTWSGNVKWTGTLESATFYVETQDGNMDMYIDDCSVIRVLSN